MATNTKPSAGLLSRELRGFFSAWTFFTRFPAPAKITLSDTDRARSLKYLPLIGLVIGALSAAVFYAAQLVLPTALAVLMAMLTSVLATGALHEDGFADSCDGFGGGWSKEQVLAIMKDSRLGSYGALGLVFLLLAKFWALLELAVHPAFGLVLVAAHSISRFAAITLVHTQSYVSASATSKSQSLAQTPPATSLLLSAPFGLAACLGLIWFGPWQSVLLALAVVLLLRWRLGRYFQRRIGGYTGDCLGAMQQASELAFYLALLVQW